MDEPTVSKIMSGLVHILCVFFCLVPGTWDAIPAANYDPDPSHTTCGKQSRTWPEDAADDDLQAIACLLVVITWYPKQRQVPDTTGIR